MGNILRYRKLRTPPKAQGVKLDAARPFQPGPTFFVQQHMLNQRVRHAKYRHGYSIAVTMALFVVTALFIYLIWRMYA